MQKQEAFTNNSTILSMRENRGLCCVWIVICCDICGMKKFFISYCNCFQYAYSNERQFIERLRRQIYIFCPIKVYPWLSLRVPTIQAATIMKMTAFWTLSRSPLATRWASPRPWEASGRLSRASQSVSIAGDCWNIWTNKWPRDITVFEQTTGTIKSLLSKPKPVYLPT